MSSILERNVLNSIYMNKFAERLNYLREQNGISRRQLAERLNVSVRLISYWENGQRECDFDTLLRLSDIFDASVDYLLGKTEY